MKFWKNVFVLCLALSSVAASADESDSIVTNPSDISQFFQSQGGTYANPDGTTYVSKPLAIYNGVWRPIRVNLAHLDRLCQMFRFSAGAGHYEENFPAYPDSMYHAVVDFDAAGVVQFINLEAVTHVVYSGILCR